MTPSASFALDAGALPENGTVVGGSASFDYSQPNTLNVNQGTDRVIINWDSFNIGESATTNFYQPNSNSLAVNRVLSKGTDPTQILGRLTANGRVMVLDRNGVIFGKNSVINVGGIIASTGDISNTQVMSGANKLDIGNLGDGEVVNNGTITVADAGLVGLVGKTAVNNGVIKAKLGKVALAAGEKTTIDLNGDGLIEIAADSSLEKAIVGNNGQISAEGGTVQMTAQAAKDAVDNVVNMNGIVDVSSVSVKGGKIVLSGNGKTTVKGKLKASGTDGGTVSVTGKNTVVTDTAEISADGHDGKGGNALIWGDNVAVFSGTLSARGKTKGGDAEISAVEGIGFDGLVDLSADNGQNGTLLIDPKTLNINNAPTSGVALDVLLGGTQTVNVNAQAIANTLRFSNVNLWATQDLNITDNIDISTWKGLLPGSQGITSNNLTLASPTINILHDVILGNGQFNLYNLPAGTTVAFGIFGIPSGGVNVNTVNLDGTISKRSTVGGALSLAGDSQLNSQANTVNILSDAARIQQGLYLVKNSGGTVNVAAGNYDGGVVVDKSVILNGTGSNFTTVVEAPTNGDGFTVSGDDVNIYGFRFTGNGGVGNTDAGIRVTSTASNVVIGKQVANPNVFSNYFDNMANGIVSSDASYIQIVKNIFNDIREVSIDIFNADGDGVTRGVDIVRNHITGGKTGINVDESFYSSIRNNVVQDQTETGINVSNSESAKVVSNRVFNITLDAFKLSDTLNALVTDNRAYNVGGDAFDINIADGLVLADNFAGSDNNAISLGSGNVGGDGYRIVEANGAQIHRNSARGITGTGISVTDSSNVVIGAEVANPNIFSNKIVDALNGITVSGGNNIEIVKNTVDKVGQTGIDVSGVVGTSDTDNVRVVRNHIKGATDGISVTDSDYARVRSNVVEDMTGGGISMLLSDNGKLISNRVFNVDGVGVSLTDSVDALIEANRVYLTGDNAFDVFGATGAVIINNWVGSDSDNVSKGTDNVQGDGFNVVDSDGVQMYGNRIRQATGAGISVTSSDNATIGKVNPLDSGEFSNFVFDSTDGIVINGGTTVNVMKNWLERIDATGIAASLVDNLRLFRNNLNYVGTGIDVTASALADIGSNVVHEVANNGINVSGSDGASLQSNRVYDTGGDGINVSGSNNAILRLNSVYLTGGDAFDVSLGSGIRILNNWIGSFQAGPSQGVGNVQGSGIVLTDVDNATVSNNRIRDTGVNGLLVAAGNVGSGLVTVSGNTFLNNPTGARFEDGTINMTGTANTFTNGDLGMYFTGNTVSLFGNTIGSTVFTNPTNYIQLANGALFAPGSPTDIDGLDATFDGYHPNVDGVVMSQAQYDSIENRILHWLDDNTLGRFFFGVVPTTFSALIDQNDIFRNIEGIPGTAGRFSVTIRGLPRIPGLTSPLPPGNAGGAPQLFAANTSASAAQALNQIATAAGDETGSVDPAAVQDVEPAAGGGDNAASTSACWGDAIAAASSGQAVTYSFDGGGADALAIAACSNPS